MKNGQTLLKAFAFIVCIAFSSMLNAQVSVTGTVLDERGETLIGVSVRVKGDEKKQAITNEDGKFSINVAKASDILIFSYMGYASTEQRVVTSKPMVVGMKEDNKFLDEVVVIGYQDVRRRDLTGSVLKANVGDMLKAPVPNFDQALAGRLAGVNVSSAEGTPGAAMNIVIRGNGSVTQDNAPLYVIDGFPIEDPKVATSINPNDIESIDVLKDASAAAIYGARGANGVIMITTKKGKIGAAQISYDFMSGVQWLSNKIPLMNAFEFVRLQSEIQTPADLNGDNGYFATIDGRTYTLEDYRNVDQFNWQDMIFREAWQQSHNVSLTGGNTEAKYQASLSYNDQDGIVLRSNYNRLQGRLGVDLRKNKLNVNMNVNYSRGVTTGSTPSQNSYSGMNNLFFSVWGYRPVTQPSVPLNSLVDNIRDTSIDETNDYRFNPIMSLQNDYRKNFATYMQFNGYAAYEFIPGLKLKISGGYTADNRRDETFNNSRTRYGYPGSTNGVNATLAVSERRTWLNENILSFQKRINRDHNINGIAGITLQESVYTSNSMNTIQIPNESLGMAGMGQGKAGLIRSAMSEWSMLSYLGRVNYDYKSKYYLTGSFRADGSSKFRENNRFGYFPSASAAWSFSEEPFMASLKTVANSAKLRLSWGQLGNNRVGDYDTYAQLLLPQEASGNFTGLNDYVHGIYPFDGNISGNIGAIPYNLPNKNLKWETTIQTNIGLDLSLFDQHVNLTVDWYNKVTSDLLLRAQLPLSSGYGSAMKNVGKVQNRGLEFTLNTVNISNKDFTWTTNFNIAFNQNKVLELTEGQESLLTNAAFDQNFTASNYIAKVGYPIGMMYGYSYAGTYKLEDFDKVGANYILKAGIPRHTTESNTQPGYPRYSDLNGDGIIDSNDQTIIGRGDPLHIGGFTNNFEYKNFDLSIFLQWSYGNDILNANRLMFETSFNKRKDLNQFESYADRWTFDNPTSDIPRVNSSPSNLLFSSRVIEDGSYLRVKTVSLGYNIPSKLLKKMSLSRARVYVSGQNLYTFTNYSGYDPEVSIKNTAINAGLDFSAYPRAASFNFGLNLTF